MSKESKAISLSLECHRGVVKLGTTTRVSMVALADVEDQGKVR